MVGFLSGLLVFVLVIAGVFLALQLFFLTCQMFTALYYFFARVERHNKLLIIQAAREEQELLRADETMHRTQEIQTRKW